MAKEGAFLRTLDWELASVRLGADTRDDAWPDPLRYREVRTIAQQGGDSLEGLLSEYSGQRMLDHPFPKTHLADRDCVTLGATDRIVYQALVDRLSPKVDPLLSSTTYSSRVREGNRPSYMFRNALDQKRNMWAAIRSELDDQGDAWLAVTDVTRYFESVSMREMLPHLKQLIKRDGDDFDQKCITFLVELLKKWSPHRTSGLPQGNIDASLFLGNVFLDDIDQRMSRSRYRVFRWMDEFIIPVRSEAHGRRALRELAQLLRGKGLVLNAQKSQLLGPGAQGWGSKVDDRDSTVDRIEEALATRRKPDIEAVIPDLVDKARSLISSSQTTLPTFRFCLSRLEHLHRATDVGVPHIGDITGSVIDLLRSHPEHAQVYCDFLRSAPLDEELTTQLEVRLLDDELCSHAWQQYMLWQTMTQLRHDNERLKARAHELIQSSSLVEPHRGAAALYLGAVGSYADRRAVGDAVDRAPPRSLTRRLMVLATQEIEKSARNNIYARLSSDDPESALIGRYASTFQEPLYVPEPDPIAVEHLSDALPARY